jgi:hypothetical protein
VVLPALVAGAIGEGSMLLALAGVAGSGADQVALALNIADHLKAQDGLKFSSHAFAVEPFEPPVTPEPIPGPKSARSPGQGGGKSAAAKDSTASQDEKLTLLHRDEARFLTITGAKTKAEFTLSNYIRTLPMPMRHVYTTRLHSLSGFQTGAIGDQAEVEFGGVNIEGGYLLTARGFVNGVVSDYFTFWCDLLVREDPKNSQLSVSALEGGSAPPGRVTKHTDRFSVSF